MSPSRIRALPCSPGSPPEFVTIHDKLSILGLGLAALEEEWKVLVGGFDAYPELWSDTEIRFPMPTVDPGIQEVVLQPKIEGLVAVPVGEVTVAKYVLPPDGASIVPGVVKLRLSTGATPETVAVDGDSFERLFPDPALNEKLARWWMVEVPEGHEEERIMAYAALDELEVAHYEGEGEPGRKPNDDLDVGGDQWGLQKARFTAAWEVRIMGAGIAVLDSGVSLNHEDMVGVVTRQVDFTGTGNLPCNFHGTAVASVAAANTNNALGISGAGITLKANKVRQGENLEAEFVIENTSLEWVDITHPSTRGYDRAVYDRDEISAGVATRRGRGEAPSTTACARWRSAAGTLSMTPSTARGPGPWSEGPFLSAPTRRERGSRWIPATRMAEKHARRCGSLLSPPSTSSRDSCSRLLVVTVHCPAGSIVAASLLLR